MMAWQRLLTPKRIGNKTAPERERNLHRNPFQQDYDRIVFSASFRRLQDKTQVFPLAETDYVRTRLTHSLETSCVGRSLGRMAGEFVLDQEPTLKEEFLPSDFGDIVAAACLAHDIGNPPFGHTGEAAISHWFQSTPYGREIIQGLKKEGSPAEEFLNFEGNAQGFRIVSCLEHRNRQGGMQLTCPTLAAMLKYPRSVTSPPKRKPAHVADKKHGFFLTERDVFLDVAETVGLKPVDEVSSGYLPLGSVNLWYSRHPLAYLVEAADDICYHIVDIEDGFRKRLISFDTARGLLREVLTREPDESAFGPQDEAARIEFLRARAIGDVIRQTVEVFKAHHAEILSGRMSVSLTERIEKHEAFERLQQVAVPEIYQSREVVEIEAAGFTVLGKLLETFLMALNEKAASDKKVSVHSRWILNLFPADPFGRNAERVKDSRLYDRVQAVTDYVSSLPDRSAVAIFRQLSGMSLNQ